MPVYLVFLVLFFVAPLAFFWFFSWQTLLRYKRTFLLTTLTTLLFGVPWDTLSVVSGLWRYDSSPTLGIWFGPLPLEEYFFTLVFPIFVVTVTIVVREHIKDYVR